MNEESGVIGDEPLVDGMFISVRMRQDFRVIDADRLLATARQAFLELHAEASPEDAARYVYCATDAIHTILERAGVMGAGLGEYAPDGLETRAELWRVTPDEPEPLPERPLRCGFGLAEDVFALPERAERGHSTGKIL